MKNYLNPLFCLLVLIMSPLVMGEERKVEEEVAWLGLSTKLSNEKPGEPEGVQIAFVWSRSPAAIAGLLEGDLIKKFDGKPIRHPAKLVRLVQKTAPGATVEIVYERTGETVKTQVKLGLVNIEELSGDYLTDLGENVPRIDPEKLSVEEAGEIWAFIEDETKIVLLDQGFAPAHVAKILKAMAAGEAALREPVVATVPTEKPKAE